MPAKSDSKRMIVFDLMRGFFMFGIIVNHLDLHPNLLALFTGSTKLWVSFAEGFFVVSGFFIGFLYKEKIKNSFREVVLKLSRRSLRLYLWTIYLTVLFTYWGNMMPVGLVKTGLWIVRPENVWELTIKTLTLRYTYGWADILPYYAVFLLVSPIYLWALKKTRWYYLFTVNLLIWLVRKDSVYLAIQPLFFAGLIAGFYSEKIKLWWMKMRAEKRYKIKTILYGVFFISLLFSVFSAFFFEKVFSSLPFGQFLIAKNRVLNLYFDKQTVGVGRLLLSPVWIVVGFFLFGSFEKKIEKYLGWLFLSFGKSSLYAYILHAFVIYPVPFLVFYFGTYGLWWNTLISLLAVSIVLAFLWFSSEAFKRRF